jgi:hypothetical protein
MRGRDFAECRKTPVRAWPQQSSARPSRANSSASRCGDATHRAHHVLDDVCTSERAAQLGRQTEPAHREDLVQSLEDALRDAGGVALQAVGEVTDQLFRLRRVVEFPGLAQRTPDRGIRCIMPSSGLCRVNALLPVKRGFAGAPYRHNLSGSGMGNSLRFGRHRPVAGRPFSSKLL